MLAPHRIGMITPSANTAVEPITIAFTQSLPQVSVHFTRIPVSEVALDEDSDRQFTSERFEAAARLRSGRARTDRRLEWNVGIVDGNLRGTDPCAAAEWATRRSLSHLDDGAPRRPCRRNVRRYSLAVPYTRDMADAIVEDYAHHGLSCLRIPHIATGLQKTRLLRRTTSSWSCSRMRCTQTRRRSWLSVQTSPQQESSPSSNVATTFRSSTASWLPPRAPSGIAVFAAQTPLTGTAAAADLT